MRASTPATLPSHAPLQDLVAGFLTGLLTVVNTLCCATLLFDGPLRASLPLGLGLSLVSATVLTAVVALRSSLPFTIAGPDTSLSALLGVVTTGIATDLATQGRPELGPSTALAAIVLGTLGTGLTLFAVGRWRLGGIVRTIPYPVLGGFLAGTGWFIAKGSLGMLTGAKLSLSTLPALWATACSKESPASRRTRCARTVAKASIAGSTRTLFHLRVMPKRSSPKPRAGSQRARASGAQGWFLEAPQGQGLLCPSPT